MKKYWVLFILVFAILQNLSAERKKVGLVLSGGGAKGLAHVGAIQVLEKAGIPIDYIVGTSMGSIIGGLYALGYSADTLDYLVRKQDWMFLLGDKVNRFDLPFTEKEFTEKYVLSFPFGGGKDKRLPSGFVRGQNIYNLFTDLTVGYHDSLDFTKLPIPFACVAANIVDGTEVVLKSGNLVQAMRASMAIPGAFTPVRMNDMVLVDGGIVNNYPADVVKAMGADIIIGVDVQSDLAGADKLNSVPDIIGQLVNLMCLNKYEENAQITDLMIKPDVKGYSAASFTKEAIHVLISNGRDAAEMQWNNLMELKKRIGENDTEQKRREIHVKDTFFVRYIDLKGITGRDEEWLRRTIKLKENSNVTLDELHAAIASLYGTKAFSAVSYRLLNGPVYDLELTLKKNLMSTVNLGFRFDSEDMAAILLNTTLNHKALRGSRVSLTGRLNKNPYVRIDYALEQPFFRRFSLAYMFRYNDFNIYSRGHKTNNVTYRYHLGELGLTDFYLKNFKFQLGLRYEYYDYDAFLYRNEDVALDVKPEGFVSYYVLAHLETLDRRYYPEKGLSFKAEYSLYTDNFTTYKGRAPFSALSADFSGIISLTNRTKLIPSAYGRVLIGHDVAYPYLNYIGGTVPGRYAPQQLSFLGISHIESADNSMLVGKLHLRQRMGRNHYLSVIANYSLQKDNFFDILGGRGIWGGGIGYSYNTMVGPVDVVFSLSDWSKKLGFYFNLGYYF